MVGTGLRKDQKTKSQYLSSRQPAFHYFAFSQSKVNLPVKKWWHLSPTSWAQNFSTLYPPRSLLVKLKKIYTVQICSTYKNGELIVEVFDSAHLRPSTQITRPQQELVAFRNKVYAIGHSTHHNNTCELCVGIPDLFMFGVRFWAAYSATS
ncbi:unnamed protein product [Phytophthora fragariaefolia]|uniref:Unnamed protein product n=1 Tax=Phytophthora fragariaefolia TaxID=1490495 RepID=A0A9W6U4V6_9STRA|nr:unnamed protein product [Phytophthora fragariaefolia]